jgi:subtilase family protein
VDVQGWGRDVATAGGLAGGPDDLRPGPDERRWYTAGFSGTSSASPMVAGALACIQGMLRAAGRPLLTPLEARDLVREVGMEQEPEAGRPDSQRIGRRPDLRAYYERVFNGASLAGGARRQPARRDEMASTKITIVIDGSDVQVQTGNGNGDSAQASNGSGNNRLTIAELLSDPQWKGPSLSFTNASDGETRQFDIRTGRETVS